MSDSSRADASEGRRFFAPGKLMLAGEYAVLLEGGEALALALELGVEVEATPADAWALARAESGLAWREGEAVPAELRHAHAAWEEGRELGVAPHRLVTRGVGLTGLEGGGKPGVGGSASACVAVLAALLGLAGRELAAEDTREALLRRARAAHRRAQGGHGSGYDVATSVVGGLVHWRSGVPPSEGEARRLTWPAGLHLLGGFSGRSSPTAPQLARVLEHGALAQERAGLGACLGALTLALQRGAIDEVLAAVRCCQAALGAWDRRRGLGLVTPELARLIALAEEAGAAAKISGAGGGDSVIALASAPSTLDEVARRWREAGFVPFAAPLSEEGARALRST